MQKINIEKNKNTPLLMYYEVKLFFEFKNKNNKCERDWKQYQNKMYMRKYKKVNTLIWQGKCNFFGSYEK